MKKGCPSPGPLDSGSAEKKYYEDGAINILLDVSFYCSITPDNTTLFLFVVEQEPAGSNRCILRLWKSQHQHAVHVFCWRCDNWGRRVSSSRHTVHKDLENTKHRWETSRCIHTFSLNTLSAAFLSLYVILIRGNLSYSVVVLLLNPYLCVLQAQSRGHLGSVSST